MAPLGVVWFAAGVVVVEIAFVLLSMEKAMAFNNISQEEFNDFHPPHLILEVLVNQQVEWLASATENVIGTLAGKTETGWKYAVLQRDTRGHFRIFKLGGNSYSRESAWSQFLSEMESAETVGPAPARAARLGL